MRKVILLFLLSPLFGFSQNQINQDSVIYYFREILNEYRTENGLSKLVVDSELKVFTDSHAKYMGSVQRVTHGEGDLSFHSRYYKDIKVGYGGENCCEILVPEKGQFKNMKSSCDDMNPILRKILDQGIDNYTLSKYAFITWKNSKSHNELLLDPRVKRFYLSYSKIGIRYYFEYLSLD